MDKSIRTATFGDQIAQSMAELREIMTAGASPTAIGRLTVRTSEVTAPSPGDARDVKKVADELDARD